MLTFLLGWLTHPVSLAIGWTLLHFLWQGAAVWLVAALCARGLRRASAARRYGVWLLLFTMLPVLPLATFLVLSPAIDPEPVPRASEDTASASTPQLGIDFSITENEQGVLGARPVFILSESQESPAEEPPPLPSAALVSFQVEHYLPWFVAAWLLGVAGCSLRLWAGLIGVIRIRWCGRAPAPERVGRLCRELQQRLGIARAVQVCESLLVQSPVVIGWLKPLILFPVGMITRLDEAQLRALLAHELAHLRRHDYLVNIFQAAVETLLFYHPAVWWLSRRLRQERELCCDDLVVQVTGDRLVYARTLSDLADRTKNPAFAAAATDGPLLARIRHILKKPNPQPGSFTGAWAIVVLALLLASGGAAWRVNAWADQLVRESTEENSEDVTVAAENPEDDTQPTIVTFSNGQSVELVGITKNTEPADKGWRPNGLPLENPGYWKSTTVLHGGKTMSTYVEHGEHPEPDANAIDFLFRFRGLRAQPSLKFYLPAGGASFQQWPVQDPYELRVSTRKRAALPGVRPFPPDGVVHVGFTDEPWGRYVKISLEGQVIDPIRPDERYAATYDLIGVMGAEPYDRAPGGSVIAVREPPVNTAPTDARSQYDLEIRGIDNDGQPHLAIAWETKWEPAESEDGSSWRNSLYGLFRQVPDGKKLSHYEFRLRPYQHWATIENVSLEPGEKSAVKASSAVVTDADWLVQHFAQALRRQAVPYLDDAKILFLSQSLHDEISAHLRNPLNARRRQELATAIEAYVQREFDPAEKDSLYLAFQNRFQTLKWVLGWALEQPELTADEILQLDRQRQWMRDEVKKLPEALYQSTVILPSQAGKFPEVEQLPESTRSRFSHQAELAKLETLFDDPLNPFFARPMPGEEFSQFQAAYQQKMEGNRSGTRLVFAASWLLQTAWTIQRDGLLQKYPRENVGWELQNLRWSLTVTRHPGNVALDIGDRRKQVRDIYLDVMKMIFVPGDAPADHADHAEWLREKGQGDLAFDGKDRALVGVRGAKLAVLEATDWQSADQIPLAKLEQLLETSGQDSIALSTFVDIDGDPANGISQLRETAPSLAIRTNEGQIAVIRMLSMAGDTPVVRARPRPLAPNPPLHPGDIPAAEPKDEEGDLRSAVRQSRETRAERELGMSTSPSAEEYQSATYLQPKLAVKIPDVAWSKPKNGVRMALVEETNDAAAPLEPVSQELTIATGKSLGGKLLFENVSDHEIHFSAYENVGNGVPEIINERGEKVLMGSRFRLIYAVRGYWRLKPQERMVFQLEPLWIGDPPENGGFGFAANLDPGVYTLLWSFTSLNDQFKEARLQNLNNEWTGTLTVESKLIVTDASAVDDEKGDLRSEERRGRETRAEQGQTRAEQVETREERPARIHDTGTLSGRFVFDGPPPAPRDYSKFYDSVEVGKPLPRDEFGRASGAHMGYLQYLQKNLKPNLEDRSLLIDQHGGIANIVVWATSKNMPVTVEKELPPAVFEVRNGSFSPPITVLRTGQTWQVENHDPVGVNVFISLMKNPWLNQLLPPDNLKQPFTTTFAQAESRPIPVQSNVVMWSPAWLMIRENSYFAVSRPDGTFAIPNLPPGEWDFRAWHERAGYLKHWERGQFRQKIQFGENSLGTITLGPGVFGDVADKLP